MSEQRPPRGNEALHERRVARQSQVIRRRRLFALLTILAVAVLGISVFACNGSSDGNQANGASGAGGAGHKSKKETVTQFQVAASGDLLIHSPIFNYARRSNGSYNFEPMLRLVKPIVSQADLGICHVETPITHGTPTGYPIFSAPADLAKAIKSTGWDVCDTASNHSLDKGAAGIAETGKILDHAGVRHTGSFASTADQAQSLIIDVKGVKVAFLAYTEMTNGIPLPKPWSVNMMEPQKIIRDAQQARQRGAQAVIVNLHWGNEYQHDPSATQLKVASALTSAPEITAVIGQHVHVVQPIRFMHGKPVIFGEGNLLSNQTAGCCPAESQDGLIALLDFTAKGSEVKVDRVRYMPTWVHHPDFTVVPIDSGIKHGIGDRASLKQSYERTVRYAGKSTRVQPIPAQFPR